MRSLLKLSDFFRGRNGSSPESQLLIEETARSWADESASTDLERERDWAVIRARLLAGRPGREPAHDLPWLLKPAFALALVAAIVVAGSLWLQRHTEMVYRTGRNAPQ